MSALPYAVSRSTTPVSEATMLLKLTFSLMGNTRKVRETVQDAVTTSATPTGLTVVTDADKRRLSYSKTLLESPELEAIKSEDARFKLMITRLCLPFDVGVLLLPSAMLETVHPLLVNYRDVVRPAMVQAFLNVYVALRDQARVSLGSLYNPHDYPSLSEVRAKFDFGFSYLSFEVPGQLAAISGSIAAEERAKQQAQWQRVGEQITMAMRQDAFDMVARLQERLTPSDDGKVKKLHETAVTHLQDFLSTLSRRNVANDAELDAVMARVGSLVNGVSTDTLRSSDKFREQLRAGLERVTGQLTELTSEMPTRRFR